MSGIEGWRGRMLEKMWQEFRIVGIKSGLGVH
jgi:hypothetical protein